MIREMNMSKYTSHPSTPISSVSIKAGNTAVSMKIPRHVKYLTSFYIDGFNFIFSPV